MLKLLKRKLDLSKVALFTSFTQENANAFTTNNAVLFNASNVNYDNIDKMYSVSNDKPATIWSTNTGYPNTF